VTSKGLFGVEEKGCMRGILLRVAWLVISGARIPMQDPSSSFTLAAHWNPWGRRGGTLEATDTWAHPFHLPQGAEFTWSEIGLVLRIFKTSLGDFNVQPGLRPAALPHFWSKMNYSP